MLVTTLLIHARDGVVELCHEGAAELSIMMSQDLHMDVCASNDSSSSLMTRTRTSKK
jgi:hypothetical protein